MYYHTLSSDRTPFCNIRPDATAIPKLELLCPDKNA